MAQTGVGRDLSQADPQKAAVLALGPGGIPQKGGILLRVSEVGGRCVEDDRIIEWVRDHGSIPRD